MKWKLMIATAALLAAVLVTPASALEYTFDNPAAGDFGVSTSADDTIRELENPNVDRSKNSALIPPGFGTPTSCLPNSGEFLTPNLAAGGPLDTPSLMETAGAGNAAGGVTLPGPVGAVSSIPPSFSVSVGTDSVGSSNFTAVTEDSYYSNGSLGTLKIPAIDLTVKIYQGTSDATLKKRGGPFRQHQRLGWKCVVGGPQSGGQQLLWENPHFGDGRPDYPEYQRGHPDILRHQRYEDRRDGQLHAGRHQRELSHPLYLRAERARLPLVYPGGRSLTSYF